MAILHRLQWLFTEQPIYLITFCTYNRRRILDRSDVHDTFIQFGLRDRERGVLVGRYVIMVDHVHLFAAFEPDSMSVSTWVKSFKNAISKALRNATFPPPHWQRRFFDHLIRSSESYDRNGYTFERTQCVQDWCSQWKTGCMRERLQRCKLEEKTRGPRSASPIGRSPKNRPRLQLRILLLALAAALTAAVTLTRATVRVRAWSSSERRVDQPATKVTRKPNRLRR
jgi:putative transposase